MPTFQNSLVLQPDKGTVIPGALPLRKVRWTDSSRGKGKRGGIRIIYIHLPSIQVLYLLDVYDKDEADDLSANDKKLLKQLAEELSQELSRRFK